jgi:hypothetical protein
LRSLVRDPHASFFMGSPQKVDTEVGGMLLDTGNERL